jgi:hypothetical protein
MKNKQEVRKEPSKYDAYINAELSLEASFLYAELRQLLFEGHAGNVQRCLERIIYSEGYCERVDVAKDVCCALYAIRRLVMVLFNKTAWLDDTTEDSSVPSAERNESMRRFVGTMRDMADACRRIENLITENV